MEMLSYASRFFEKAEMFESSEIIHDHIFGKSNKTVILRFNLNLRRHSQRLSNKLNVRHPEVKKIQPTKLKKTQNQQQQQKLTTIGRVQLSEVSLCYTSETIKTI